MSCTRPSQIQFSVASDGKKVLKFQSYRTWQMSYRFAYKKASLSSADDFVIVPCGKCLDCRLARSREWALRCYLESKLHDYSLFLTLTYRDEDLPADRSVHRSDITKFMKDLRSYIDYHFPDHSKISVFGCGEYGGRTSRPHYHLCIFGLDPHKFKLKFWKKSKLGDKYYNSKILEKIWKKGFVVIGLVTLDSAAYVARYCVKKMNGKDSDRHYLYRDVIRNKEFVIFSQKPGVGLRYFEKHKDEIYASDSIIVDKRECRPPRYFDKKLKQVDLALYEKVIKKRRLESKTNLLKHEALKENSDLTFKRFLAKEKKKILDYKRLIRSIEDDS